MTKYAWMTSVAVVGLLFSAAGIAASSSFREQFATVGVVPEPSTPQELGAFIRSEIEKWSGVMKFAGMKQEAY